jgi:hypothetical protein
MSLTCPKCGSEISPWKLKAKFLCWHCHATLISNSRSITIVSVVLWSLVEVLIKIVVFSSLSNQAFGFFVSMALSGAFGFSLYYVLVQSCSTIKAAATESSSP